MAIRLNDGGSRSFPARGQRTSLVNKPANASHMRAFVCDFLEGADIPDHVMHEILMAVGEVVANACRHGRSTSGQGMVDLKCERRGETLSIRITDEGPGFDTAAVFRPGVPDLLSQGGRGFFLMRQLMDKVDVRSDSTGTTVILERALPQ